METKQRVEKQRLVLRSHVDVELLQVCVSLVQRKHTRVLLFQTDRHAVVEKFRLQRLHVVVQCRRENDVLTGCGNEVDDLIHVVGVTVGEKLSIKHTNHNNHICFIDDKCVDAAKQIVRVELHVAQKQLGSGDHHIRVGVHIGSLLLDIGVVQRHTVHSAATVASQTLKAVERLNAQLLRGN